MCDKDSMLSNQIEDSDSKFSVQGPRDEPEECWKCWKVHHFKFENEVKILNPKYCWLYPKKTFKKLKQVVPNFDDCETLYSKCDFKLEACVHEQILKVEDALKILEKTFRKEIRLQRELIEKIWEISARYGLLTESSCCVKYYPEIVSAPTERRTLCEFQTTLKKLKLSNCRLNDLLNQTKAEIDQLDHRCSHLDMTLKSPFIVGDGRNNSLADIRHMIADLFNYFYSIFCELRSWAQLLDPFDIAAVEDYKAILQSVHDYDGFLMVGVPVCSCRRAQFVNCIKQHKPC